MSLLTVIPPQACLLGMMLLAAGCWLADRIGGPR